MKFYPVSDIVFGMYTIYVNSNEVLLQRKFKGPAFIL
jgi:hypothetical protein